MVWACVPTWPKRDMSKLFPHRESTDSLDIIVNIIVAQYPGQIESMMVSSSILDRNLCIVYMYFCPADSTSLQSGEDSQKPHQLRKLERATTAELHKNCAFLSISYTNGTPFLLNKNVHFISCHFRQ